MMKYLLKGTGPILAHSARYSCCGQEVEVTGAGSNCAHCIHEREAEKRQ